MENDVKGLGRPTSYKPEICDQLMVMGAQGFHIVEMAAALGVSVDTLYRWSKDPDKPDFSESFTRAKELSQAYYWRVGRDNHKNKDFNFKTWEFGLRAKMGLLQNSNPLFIPGFRECNSNLERIECVLKALGDEKISPEDCERAISAIKSAIAAEQELELRPMLENLERELKNQKENR